MIIGFTGSRKGMTGAQSALVLKLLVEATEGHHGDCVGADEQFHELCRITNTPVVIHPPDNDSMRAFCEGAIRVEVPRPYLVRNRMIVDASHLLVAAPKEEREPPPQRGQGTWSTIRYARRSSRRFRIVWPEGIPYVL